MRGQGEDSKGIECCMCGDSGLSHELLLCSSCRLRSQHRYCSNAYPNSESYDICNWCLDKSHKSSSNNTTSFRRTNKGMVTKRSETSEKSSDVKRPKRLSAGGDRRNGVGRDKSLSSSSSSGTKNGGGHRRRIVRKGKVEEIAQLRRTNSEDISNQNNGSRVNIVKNGRFRNIKVRRYKHLDEVSN